MVNLSSQPQLVVNADMSKTDIKYAEEFLSDWVYTPRQIEALAKLGNVGPFIGNLALVKRYAPSDLRKYMLFELGEAKAKQSFLMWSQYVPTADTTTWEGLLDKLFTLGITPAKFAAAAAKL